MTVQITSSKRDVHYVKLCLYGQAGVGKTVACSTAPKPLIISAEAGLLSLANKDIAVIEINSLGELKEAFSLVKENKDFETICLDSISDIAEQILDAKLSDLQRAAEESGSKGDPRQAYGKLAIELMQLTRAFRALDKNIVFTAKMSQVQDDMKLKYGPMLPGQLFTQNLPYMMDLLFAMRVTKDGDRYFQTQPDIQYQAKDRSGKLDKIEKPDLTYIFKKVIN